MPTPSPNTTLKVVNTTGKLIGWVKGDCIGPDPNCKRDHSIGRPVHVVPASITDNLGCYHVASFDAGVEVLKILDMKRNLLKDETLCTK